jgi:kinetochore protein NDC80
MYGRGIRDERPIHDRQYQNSQSVFLLGYLVDNHFNSQLSQRDLMHPTSKKFQEIVNFLFRQIDPNFRFQKNIVNDVHTMFKGLRYPVQISKTALSSVGAAHSWPALLASLTWLVDLICFDAKALEAAQEQANDDVDAIFFEYLCSAYESFMANDDEKYQALDEELAATFQTRDDEVIAETEAIAAKNAALRRELEELQQAASSLPGLLEEQRMLEDELNKIGDHVGKVENQQALEEQKLAASSKKLAVKQAALATSEAHRADLQEQLRTQDLSAADVERIAQDRGRLRQQLAAAEEAKEELHSRLWNIEQGGAKAVLKLEEAVRAYNDLAMQLKLVPAGAKNAEGRDFELRVADDVLKAKSTTPVLTLDLKRTVKPAVRAVQDKYKAKMQEAREATIRLEESLRATSDAQGEREEEIVLLEQKIAKAEEQIRAEKVAMEEQVAQLSAETAECEIASREISAQESPNMLLLRNELSEAEAQLEETKTDIGHARSILRNQLFERLHMATDHKSAMEEMLSASLRSCESCMGQVLDQQDDEEEEGEGVKEEQ